MNKDILICGVGGQGTVLASKLIASAAMHQGNKVHSAETIGMAQRGGSVTSHVRVGEAASSPLIPQGAADVLIAFEPAEAVRNLGYLKADGVVIVNQAPVKPTTDSLKAAMGQQASVYEAGTMIDYLKTKVPTTVVVDGDGLCARFGSAKFLNVALLGVAVGTGRLELDKDVVLSEIAARVPERFIEKNTEAFEAGYALGAGA